LPEALSIARDLDLDLVEVAPLADPPVCRILDYGKWKYEAAQREKESRRKATHAAIKEMKYRPKIGGGDFDTKTRKVGEFIDQGHKVKITIMFRGREVAHPELGKKILDRIAEQLSTAKVEAAPKLDGRNMIMVLAPDRRARQASQAKSEHDEAAPAPDGTTPATTTGAATTTASTTPTDSRTADNRTADNRTAGTTPTDNRTAGTTPTDNRTGGSPMAANGHTEPQTQNQIGKS
jgi:translation initiation factor IF-3